ncbi:MAG TPA: carbon storage regulator [Ktedonobacterales bacterium]
MLVLRRKAGEAIVLNGAITIYVLAVEGERVKLGISAPPEVVIVRSELLEGPGMGAPMGAPMSGPLGATGGPPMPPGGSGSSYPRPPRLPSPPDRSWREPERPWREPEAPMRPRPPMPPMPPAPRRDLASESEDNFSGPSRYTPRSRYDTYAPYSGVRDERESVPQVDEEHDRNDGR